MTEVPQRIFVRRLAPADAAAFQSLRLQALRDEPLAFGASLDEEIELDIATIEARLAPKSDRGVFGAFEADALIGLAGLGRENLRKLAHKAFIWGMYVAPQARGRGAGRALLQAAIALAAGVPEIRQVNLCVNPASQPALHLYQSLGFEIFGREPDAMQIDGELHDEMHMCLRLKEARSANQQ